MKRPGTEKRLANLKQAVDDPGSLQSAALLRAALADVAAPVITRAAQIISEHSLDGFGADLDSSLERLLDAGGEADKGCLAKIAIADALYKLGTGKPELLLRGLRSVQMEPVWGKHIDVAGNLRGLCALALASMNYPDVLFELAALLFDSEKETRLHVARAVALTEQAAAELILRMKIMAGDDEAEVTAECLTSLMKMSPHRSLEFVAKYLDQENATIRDSAALALGESHLPQAFAHLRACWDKNVLAEQRTGLLLPMALLRSDEAFGFLLQVVAEAEVKIAQAAVSACRMYANDDARAAQIERTVKKRRLANLTESFRQLLETS